MPHKTTTQLYTNSRHNFGARHILPTLARTWTLKLQKGKTKQADLFITVVKSTTKLTFQRKTCLIQDVLMK